MCECDPVNIILITSSSHGQRLLFRYPYEERCDSGADTTLKPNINETIISEDLSFISQNPYRFSKNTEEAPLTTKELLLQNSLLYGFEDPLLATMLAPKLALCDQNFELKIEQKLFVGFLVLVTHDDDSGFEECAATDESEDLDDVTIKMVHVVLVLYGNTDARVISHYQSISKMLGKSLRHEEKRCRYLTSERETMFLQKELSEKKPECEQNTFGMILKESKLAQDLVEVFNSICTSGIVQVAINGWLNLNYCLPHKIHRLTGSKTMIDPCKFNKFISSIKPYHTILLTGEGEQSLEDLTQQLPPDASPALVRLIKHSNHIKSFQTLCQDADISLPQIFQVVAHLLYWGKCTVIYPMAESNVYVLSENAPTAIDSKYAEEFVKLFPKQSLHDILARFSFPMTLGEYRNPIYNDEERREQFQIVKWLLKYRLLKQLHTYIYIMPEVTTNDELQFDEQISMDERKGEKLNFKPNEYRILDKFSAEEKRSLFRMIDLVDKEDLSFFFNMSKYFRGEHHLEDIMYYENVPRSKLLILIDKFRSMLITVQHEDTSTSRLV